MTDSRSNAMAKKIPLMESFGPTIQGEGVQIGVQTYFMRFGLCDYKCTMCDSMHAVDPIQVKHGAKWLTQEEIFNDFVATGVYKGVNSCEWMTFTGGNPCIHDLTYLIHLLKGIRLKVNVETQGTFAPYWLGECDQVTISPKGPGMGEVTDINVLRSFLEFCSLRVRNYCVKIVVFDQRDLDFAADMYAAFNGTLVDEDQWFLSLGNPHPPAINFDPYAPALNHTENMVEALQQYRVLFEDIQNHPTLSKMRFLPQWHWFVWADALGR